MQPNKTTSLPYDRIFKNIPRMVRPKWTLKKNKTHTKNGRKVSRKIHDTICNDDSNKYLRTLVSNANWNVNDWNTK